MYTQFYRPFVVNIQMICQFHVQLMVMYAPIQNAFLKRIFYQKSQFMNIMILYHEMCVELMVHISVTPSSVLKFSLKGL